MITQIERLDAVSDVRACAEAFVEKVAQGPQQRRLLQIVLERLKKYAQEDVWFPVVNLPLFVYAGLCEDNGPARPLAMATAFIFLGADLLDDLADGDLEPSWQGYQPKEIQLAAATLLSSLPQLVLSELPVSPGYRLAMQRALAQGLLRMSFGQQLDLAMNGKTNFSSEDVVESVAAKSGEEMAIFSRLAAQLAEAPDRTVQAYAEFGRAFGTASQLASDCHDIFQAELSRDLFNGTRTLPIAMYLERLKGDGREKFLELLEEARKDSNSREIVRRQLHADGILMRCAFRVEVYCQKALGILDSVRPREPAAKALQEMVEHVSFFK